MARRNHEDLTVAEAQNEQPRTVPYSGEFEQCTHHMPHLYGSHAVLHAVKSLGKLAAVFEAIDHRGGGKLDVEQEVIEAMAADLFTIALRLANLYKFSLAYELRNRVLEKNGVDIFETHRPREGDDGTGKSKPAAVLDDDAEPWRCIYCGGEDIWFDHGHCRDSHRKAPAPTSQAAGGGEPWDCIICNYHGVPESECAHKPHLAPAQSKAAGCGGDVHPSWWGPSGKPDRKADITVDALSKLLADITMAKADRGELQEKLRAAEARAEKAEAERDALRKELEDRALQHKADAEYRDYINSLP